MELMESAFLALSNSELTERSKGWTFLKNKQLLLPGEQLRGTTTCQKLEKRSGKVSLGKKAIEKSPLHWEWEQPGTHHRQYSGS
jgi:hypothetical protein